MAEEKKKFRISKRLIATVILAATVIVCGAIIIHTDPESTLTVGSIFNGKTVAEVMTPSSGTWYEADTLILVTAMDQADKNTGTAELLIKKHGEKPYMEKVPTVLVEEKWLIDRCK